MLELKHLSVRRGNLEIIRNVSMKIQDGETVS